MTFQVKGQWLAAKVFQVDRVAMASRLWPVPMAEPEHLGLYDSGQELIPVLQLDNRTLEPLREPQMIAILHVRGESVGLAIDKAGRIFDRYWQDTRKATAPYPRVAMTLARTTDDAFWLLDPDQLFAFDTGGGRPTPMV